MKNTIFLNSSIRSIRTARQAVEGTPSRTNTNLTVFKGEGFKMMANVLETDKVKDIILNKPFIISIEPSKYDGQCDVVDSNGIRYMATLEQISQTPDSHWSDRRVIRKPRLIAGESNITIYDINVETEFDDNIRQLIVGDISYDELSMLIFKLTGEFKRSSQYTVSKQYAMSLTGPVITWCILETTEKAIEGAERGDEDCIIRHTYYTQKEVR